MPTSNSGKFSQVKVVDVKEVKDLPKFWMYQYIATNVQDAIERYLNITKRIPETVYRYVKSNRESDFYIPIPGQDE